MTRPLPAALCSVLFFGASATAASAATVVADNGFRPDTNGFSFQNYGNDAGNQNLTAVEMEKLFGKRVCANGATHVTPEPAPAPSTPSGRPLRPPSGPSRPSEPGNGDSAGDAAAGGCTLTPPAQQWMDEQNKSMADGHCNGFAVLTEELFKQQFPAFSGGTPFSYQLSGNSRLQRSIAYAFVYQVLDSVVSGRIKGTPNQILATLQSALNPTNAETYTLGIYKPDGSGGHAITPFAVVNNGGGMYAVHVYDNNYPGEVRDVLFNTNANTWSYNAAINPSVPPELYSGAADNPGIELDPTTPGEGVQPCPFCQARGGASAAAARHFDTVQLLGNKHYHAHLVIRDRQGHKVGVVNGRIVNTFPGAEVAPSLAFNDFTSTQEPAYLIPNRSVNITVDGSHLQHTDVENLSVVGPGQDVAVQNLNIGPGRQDVLDLMGGTKQISFTSSATGQTGSPVLRIGADGTKVDFALRLKLVAFHPGATLHVTINQAKQLLTFHASGNPGAATYVLSAVKETRTADYQLGSDTVHLHGNQAVTYSYVK